MTDLIITEEYNERSPVGISTAWLPHDVGTYTLSILPTHYIR